MTRIGYPDVASNALHSMYSFTGVPRVLLICADRAFFAIVFSMRTESIHYSRRLRLRRLEPNDYRHQIYPNLQLSKYLQSRLKNLINLVQNNLNITSALDSASWGRANQVDVSLVFSRLIRSMEWFFL